MIVSLAIRPPTRNFSDVETAPYTRTACDTEKSASEQKDNTETALLML